jgi:hypothetical protein
MGGLWRPRLRRLIGLLALCSILGLSLFLFSPWHEHPRLCSTPCAFSSFEHGACEDIASHELPIRPPAQWVWLSVLPEPVAADLSASGEAPVRAPPAR